MLTQRDIDLVKEIYTKKTLSIEDNDFSKVFEVSKLKDFYINPKDMKAFAKALETAIEIGKEFGTQLYSTKKTDYNLKQIISYTTGYLIILAIKSYIDLDLFHSQIEKARSISPENKQFLKERLFNLTEGELKSWFEIVGNFNINFMFISEGHIYDMRQEINTACYNNDPAVQQITDENFVDFFCTTSELFNDYRGREFEYLDSKTICEIIFKYIDGEFYLLGRLCEIIHNDGYDAAVNYITGYTDI